MIDARSFRTLGSGLALSLILVASAGAQQAPPSPKDVLGYDIGERFTPPDALVRYMDALAAAAPDRVQVRRYGETQEGRPLLQVVIASPPNLARLDEILAEHRKLIDPDLSAAEAKRIAAEVPAVLYFSYGVHGNESSSSEAAIWTAWDLARGSSETAGVLDSAIVVIDPAVNPDGRARYVEFYKQARGATPNPDPASREHDEPWPGGRYNHYLFDMNRDWSWMMQAPTRARLATWDYWSPQVHVDFHEMSPRSTYFFFPAAKPVNPIYPKSILDWAEYFGRANAAAFDTHGWRYFTRGTYDFFYPGYGDSWPGLTGAIGMTYEQAGGGSAGLAYARPDGDTLTLRDRAMHHRTTGEATARAAAARKTALLEDYAAFHRSVDEGQPDFLIVPGEDPARAEALVAVLEDEGIRVERAASSLRADGRSNTDAGRRSDFPAGTFLVRARQPRGRLAVTLLQPETHLDATFSYDISAWSLPFAYGVSAYAVDAVPSSAGWQAARRYPRAFQGVAAAGNAARAAEIPGADAAGAPTAASGAGEPYGYLVAPGFAAWPALVRYLENGGRATVLDEGFTLDDRTWAPGTVFLRRMPGRSLNDAVAVAGLGGRAVAVSTGLTPEGNDLGTGDAYPLRLPQVGVIAGEGVFASSYGAHWYFLEQMLGLPFDALLTSALERTDLSDYDVLVLPEARPSKAVVDRLAEWVKGGGTLVAVGSGARAVADPVAGIRIRESPKDTTSDLSRALRGRDARELEDWEQEVPGTILPVALDPANPLAFGAGVDGDPSRLFILHSTDWGFEPSDTFETAGYFPEDLPKVSGVISSRNLEKLSQSAWLVTRRVGQGRVVLFADDPLFRAFWYSGFQPYVNALLVGPAL